MWECEALEDFPLGVSNLVALEELHFARCRALKRIPESFGTLTNLKLLHMFGCEGLEEFHVGVSNLIALEYLDFATCRALKRIPESFGNLTKLKIMRMWGCEALGVFPVVERYLRTPVELDGLKEFLGIWRSFPSMLGCPSSQP